VIAYRELELIACVGPTRKNQQTTCIRSSRRLFLSLPRLRGRPAPLCRARRHSLMLLMLP
jgi:hypothetical protein